MRIKSIFSIMGRGIQAHSRYATKAKGPEKPLKKALSNIKRGDGPVSPECLESARQAVANRETAEYYQLALSIQNEQSSDVATHENSPQ